jgi:hypothetical protein
LPLTRSALPESELKKDVTAGYSPC